MPELPEVTALARDLEQRLAGRTIRRLDVTAFSALKTYDPPVESLAGATVTGVERRGKFLVVAVRPAADDGELFVVVHLALLGWLRWRAQAPAPGAGRGKGPIAARLILDGDGAGFDLTEQGTKKGLAIWVVRSPDEVPGIARLGPDPLADDFTVETLADILSTQGRARIKGVLRSQALIAGIGNAYSDEILHAARMSPFKPADMARADVEVLFAAMQSTLRAAIDRADGVSAADLKAEKKSNLQVHGRTGLPCPVCGDTVRQVIYADSTFQYCPTCQTGGTPLADRVLSRLLK